MPWSTLGAWLTTPVVATGLRLAALVAVALFLTRVLRRALARLERRVSEETTPMRALQRTQTLVKVGSSVGIITIWSIVGFYALAALGFDLRPLLAGVGILGVALGFGAQNLVRDVVNGFFIVFEDQYGIGDTIEINAVATGKVEHLTLRLTGVRGVDGTMHYISNGSIEHVANRSKDWSRALVDLRVPYDEDLDRVRAVVERVAREAKEEPELGRRLYAVPQIQGIQAIEGDSVVLRLAAETKPGRQSEVARQIRERIKDAFDSEEIQLKAG